MNNLKLSTDLELISLVKDGNNDAFDEICERYENIFYKICQRYSVPLSLSGVNVNDIFEDKNYIIYYCSLHFNPSKKTKLSTMIGNYARYLCLNSINERKHLLKLDDEEVKTRIENNQISSNFFLRNNDDENFKYILNILSQIKDGRITEIFKYRYLDGKKMIWGQIAKKMGLSTQTAINLHNKGINILKNKTKSKEFSDVI
jgi:RNA polymerase sigma factor (sigma-70 family)